MCEKCVEAVRPDCICSCVYCRDSVHWMCQTCKLQYLSHGVQKRGLGIVDVDVPLTDGWLLRIAKGLAGQRPTL